MIFPERAILELTKYFVSFTRENYFEETDKEKTYLYELFGNEPNMGNYNFFDNAVAIFTTEEDHPKHIEVHLGLNQERFAPPTIHITMPNEKLSPVNGIGYDFMFLSKNYQPDDPMKLSWTNSRNFNAIYNVVFTSDNTFETLIMYRWFQSCFIGNIELPEYMGLQQCVPSGGDIDLMDHLGIPNIYSKAFGLECIYEITAPNFNKYHIPTKVRFIGKLIP